MRKKPKYSLVTRCCGGSVYRNGKIVKCQFCEQPARFIKRDLSHPAPIPKVKHEDKKLADFPPYKPVWNISRSGREEEATKRRQVISDYEILKPSDPTEIKFIKQRIKWNNERIALLLG